jgi:DNA-binding CsgD family transcriptional regulator
MLARIRVHLANARMTQSARAALDVSGRFLLAVNRDGRIMWATPQAQKLLADSLGAGAVDEVILPESLRLWLEQAQAGKGGAKEGGTKAAAAIPDHPELKLHYMGNAGSNEFLLRLAKESTSLLPAALASEFRLTTREGEVLSWLSKGKTNRDIAQILGLSPRTVDKHLEQIYAKLGVENRTAAAAIATDAARRET